MSSIPDNIKSEITTHINKTNKFLRRQNILLNDDDVEFIQNFQTHIASEEIEAGRGFRFNRLCTFNSIDAAVKEYIKFSKENKDMDRAEFKLRRKQLRKERALAKEKGRAYRLNIKKVNHHLFSYRVC